MDARFYISADKTSSCVEIEMGGFFFHDDIRRFAESLRFYVATLTCPPHQHATLCDIRDMEIQSQDAVEGFKAIVDQGRVRSRKLAFVTAKTLARMQAGRVVSRDHVRFFTELDEARAWLRC